MFYILALNVKIPIMSGSISSIQRENVQAPLHGVAKKKGRDEKVDRSIDREEEHEWSFKGRSSSLGATSQRMMTMSPFVNVIIARPLDSQPQLSLDFTNPSVLSNNEPSPPFYRIREPFSRINVVGSSLFQHMPRFFFTCMLYFFLWRLMLAKSHKYNVNVPFIYPLTLLWSKQDSNL